MVNDMGEKINENNARELGAIGGRKSGEVRRNKRNMRETLEVLLSMPFEKGRANDIEKSKSFEELGDKNLTVSDVLMVKLITRAMRGDMQAMAMIREQIGEKPKDELEITTIKVPKFEGEDELED